MSIICATMDAYNIACANRRYLVRAFEHHANIVGPTQESSNRHGCIIIPGEFRPFLSPAFITRWWESVSPPDIIYSSLPCAEKMRLVNARRWHWAALEIKESMRSYDPDLIAYNPDVDSATYNRLRAENPNTKFHPYVEHRAGNYVDINWRSATTLPLPSTIEHLKKPSNHLTYIQQAYIQYSLADPRELEAIVAPSMYYPEMFAFLYQTNPWASIEWLAANAQLPEEKTMYPMRIFGRFNADDYMKLPEPVRRVVLPVEAPLRWWRNFMHEEVDLHKRRRIRIRMMITNNVPFRVIVRECAITHRDYANMMLDYCQHIANIERALRLQFYDRCILLISAPGGLSYHEAIMSIESS